jgi:hypothetical protein
MLGWHCGFVCQPIRPVDHSILDFSSLLLFPAVVADGDAAPCAPSAPPPPCAFPCRRWRPAMPARWPRALSRTLRPR